MHSNQNNEHYMCIISLTISVYTTTRELRKGQNMKILKAMLKSRNFSVSPGNCLESKQSDLQCYTSTSSALQRMNVMNKGESRIYCNKSGNIR